ncbi:MAG: cohesin domain-containing protein, partial [Candidatus Methanomethylophilaceae archaeon]|nr:cohesin domain-containing protein [Candidatus Methanomethylophilaceae archaeon]
MKKYSLSVLFFTLCMLVTAAGAAWIEAPGGLLAPESTGVFPVSTGGLMNAQEVHFNLTFDGTLLSVESVSASSAITGSNVTANIDNEGGWVQVAVTNTEGITVNETWPLTPLVDITFRSTTNEGASAIEFAGTPTYSQGGDFMPEEFWTNFGRIKVGDPATIRAPSGTLAYGESRTFAVGVNNLTGATQIWFELMYDGSHLVIDDIAPTLPSAVITGAFANNGIYEFEPTALESVPEEVRLNLQQYHGSNLVWVELEIPGGLTTTGYTDVVDITFRPTNLTGTGDLDFYYHCTYQDENESTQLFDLQVPGQIVTNGGGSYPVLGEFKAPSGTVDTGSQKVLPLMVRSLNNAEEAYVWAEWNSTVINATSLSLSATARDAGVTLEGGDVYSYVYDNISVGYLYAYVGNLTRLNTASWTPLLDLTVRANATSGRTPVNISGSSSTIPRENVSIAYPPASLENGLIILDAMPVDAMQIGLGDVGAAKGQTTRASLTIRNASAIGAGGLDMTYDPAVVTVDAVNFASPWEGASSINNTNGKARLAYYSSSGYGQSGDISICTVTLRATGEPGDISP